MELLDYARLHRAKLIVAFVVGLVAIAVAASGSFGAQRQYAASTTVLVRPPAAQLGVFGQDLDRYVDTEIASMQSTAGLQSEAKGTSMSASELRGALTATHAQGSDVVTLTVQAGSPDTAISTVNRVAEAYLDDASSRTVSANGRAIDYLQGRLEQERQDLAQANRRLARSVQPDADASVNPTLAAPQAYSDQQLALGAVQQTQQQIQETQLASRGGTLSRVLDRADSASPAARRWQLTTIAAGVAGLALALVVLTAVALSFSRRVVSVDRWNRVTSGSALRPAVRVGARGQQDEEIRRIVTSVANTGLTGPVAVRSYPTQTKRTQRQTARITRGLEAAGVPCREENDVTSSSNGAGHRIPLGGPTVAVVDLAVCRTADAELLADGDPTETSQIVPALL